MSEQSFYAARPWQKHHDYWVRPQLTYPGRPLSDILSATVVDSPDRPAADQLRTEIQQLLMASARSSSANTLTEPIKR